jgi:putative ABC transport system substrate-binding protein
MRRREFIASLAGTAAWPVAARAQQTTMPVIGFLNAQSASAFAHLLAAFHMGLGQAGYVERRNVAIEYRWAEGRIETLPVLAAELVRRSVDVIVATGGAHLAAKSVTSTIPIVFTSPDDPIKEGLVASFNKPGGNATGATTFSATIETKRLALLHELIPNATVIAALVDPRLSSADIQLMELQAAARAIGKQVHILNATTDNEIEIAFASISKMHADALLIGATPFFNSRRSQIIALSLRYALPVMSETREFATGGLLTSYGPSIIDAYRQVGVYTGRILKGEKPADLPVVQPSKIDFVINLKTAKALGISVPPTLLALADEVIE